MRWRNVDNAARWLVGISGGIGGIGGIGIPPGGGGIGAAGSPGGGGNLAPSFFFLPRPIPCTHTAWVGNLS